MQAKHKTRKRNRAVCTSAKRGSISQNNAQNKAVPESSNHTATRNHGLPQGENISQMFLIDTGVSPGILFQYSCFLFTVPESTNLTLVISFYKNKNFKVKNSAFPSVLFLYLTNIIFFHWHGGKKMCPEHIITSFRNQVILLANVKSCCSVW